MRVMVGAALLAAVWAGALATGAEAHVCQAEDYRQGCGPCVEGEAHTHQTIGTGEQCVTVKRQPGFEAAAGLGAVGLAALVLARRR